MPLAARRLRFAHPGRDQFMKFGPLPEVRLQAPDLGRLAIKAEEHRALQSRHDRQHQRLDPSPHGSGNRSRFVAPCRDGLIHGAPRYAKGVPSLSKRVLTPATGCEFTAETRKTRSSDFPPRTPRRRDKSRAGATRCHAPRQFVRPGAASAPRPHLPASSGRTPPRQGTVLKPVYFTTRIDPLAGDRLNTMLYAPAPADSLTMAPVTVTATGLFVVTIRHAGSVAAAVPL